MSAVVGQDILIECQASGDPHPDIIWKKDDGDIDVTKVRIVHGKGLRIENARPSDAGTYVCTAKNIVGSVTSSAVLKVLEPPVISVRPPLSLSKQTSQPVQVRMHHLIYPIHIENGCQSTWIINGLQIKFSFIF